LRTELYGGRPVSGAKNGTSSLPAAYLAQTSEINCFSSLAPAGDLMQFAGVSAATGTRYSGRAHRENIMYVAATKRLTHQGARHMVAVAVEQAQTAGIAIAVAVADSGGHLIVLERMDGGRFHTVHSATTKAVCAASNKRPTSAQGAQAQPLDVVQAIGLALAAGPERWTALQGGFPVIVEGECIGGIGVSGGDWETDARIARAAVEAIGAAWSM
jgi:glc operon protein GlcG